LIIVVGGFFLLVDPSLWINPTWIYERPIISYAGSFMMLWSIVASVYIIYKLVMRAT